jgi:translation initiation factor eIF-2B subunit epsilon
VLITGDVISNMDLKKVINFHKERRKVDNDAIMTVVLKNVQKSAGIKPILDDLVVALDSDTNQILFFEDSIKSSTARIPVEIMESHSSVEFRSDLLDCHIDICSPELLLQFSDNFDYHDIRKQFIHNEAVNWELGMHIFGYILQNEYAARVHEPRSYHAICNDIMKRWVSPLVPDSVLLPDSSYTHIGRYVYKENGVRIARSAKIGPGVVLGRGSVVEENAELVGSVIGRDCIVGANVIIRDSHVWSKVVVNENAEIISAIVCDEAVVKKGARISRGCILSYGVVIGENVTLPEYSRISRHRQAENSSSESQNATVAASTVADDFDFEILGKDGMGYVYCFDANSTGAYDDDASSESHENSQAGGGVQIDPLKASSLGCVEEEAWKKSLWVINKKMLKPLLLLYS